MLAHYVDRWVKWRQGQPLPRRAMIWQIGLPVILFAATGYSQTLYPFHQASLLGNGQVSLQYPTGRQVQIHVTTGFANPQRAGRCVLVLSDGQQTYQSDMIDASLCSELLKKAQERMPGF